MIRSLLNSRINKAAAAIPAGHREALMAREGTIYTYKDECGITVNKYNKLFGRIALTHLTIRGDMREPVVENTNFGHTPYFGESRGFNASIGELNLRQLGQVVWCLNNAEQWVGDFFDTPGM